MSTHSSHSPLQSSPSAAFSLRIVFMGTPDFAAHILRTMHTHGRTIVGVVTMPDKRSGRGMRSTPSAVKVTAEELLPDLPLMQPTHLQDPDFLTTLRSLQADLFVVVAFRMLPAVVWDMPPRGTINLHASLLPKYRGAAPIQRAIMGGESESGVTTFVLDHEIDTGRLLISRTVALSPDETAGTLHDKLMLVGGDVVEETLTLIESHPADHPLGTPQQVSDLSTLPMAPKIFKEDRLMHFGTSSALLLERQVRGLSPYPAAIALLHSGDAAAVELKVYGAAVATDAEVVATGHTALQPGQIATTPDRKLIVGTQQDALRLLEIQWPSKKRTTVESFLLGHSFGAHDYFD